MAITLGLVEAIDSNGVYVSMPGSRGVLRGPYRSLSTVAAGTTVLVASTDDGEQVVVGASPGQDGVYNVVSFGAVGDNVADDTEAIQAAIDAAGGTGGVVHFPPGTYRCAGALTVPDFVKLRGSLHEAGSPAGYTMLRFTADADSFNAITCGAYVTIENLVIRGTYTYSHTTDGIVCGSLTLSNVSVGGFWRGVAMTNGYYSVLTRCEFTRNARHIELTGCYNVNLYGCAFTDDAAYGYGADTYGIEANTVRSLNIFGGSIESYKYGIKIGSGGVHLYGVYFETGYDGNNDATGVYAGASNGVNLHMTGCTIYLNSHDQFVYFGDGAVDGTITAHGNVFCSGASANAGIAYDLGTDSSNAYYLSGDSWDAVADAGATYVNTWLNSGARAGSHIDLPKKHTGGAWGTQNADWTFLGRGLYLPEGCNIKTGQTTGSKIGESQYEKIGFYGATPVTRPTVTGSRGGNAALASLLTQLANLGLITDSSS